MAYRFGTFLYDPVSHGLLKDGAEIPLTHKSRELLLLFRPGDDGLPEVVARTARTERKS